MTRGWRDKAIIALLVPILVFPLVVIGAGGDLELVVQELRAFSRFPLTVAVYAQNGPSPTMTMSASPTVTMGPSPTVTLGPSPGVTLTPGVGAPVAAAPLLTRWAMISASIVLALVALWAINRRIAGDHSRS
jgi:hypothetical protein